MPGTSARSDLASDAIVLDASAAVEVTLWTEAGARLASHVATADQIVVPDHFHLECAAALRRMEFRNALSRSEAQSALQQILALRVRRVDTVPVIAEAWTMRRNVTIADALYVVIARRLGLPLVTGDARLARAPQLGIEVLTGPGLGQG